MLYFFAAFPVLLVLILMIAFRWSGQRAGPAGWVAAVAVGALAFGLTPQVWWVSQLKGLLLSLYVSLVLWPALLLYYIIDRIGGIRAIAGWLAELVGETGLLQILLAWAFSAVQEGMAGFGLPIAVTAPMLVGLGVSPLRAVAAVAAGHAWVITFGGMGLIFQTLVAVSGVPGAELAAPAALMLGAGCLLSGLCAAFILGQGRFWREVLVIAVVMAGVQYGLAVSGLPALAGLGASLAGLIVGIMLGRGRNARPISRPTPALIGALAVYGGIIIFMTAVSLPGVLHSAVEPFVWKASFEQVTTATGFVTPPGSGPAFRWFLHPGFALSLAAVVSYLVFRWLGLLPKDNGKTILTATWHSAAPATVGVIAMVGVAMLMEHCGMSLLLAQGLSTALGTVYPLAAPFVGMLGAFATGSNNNSNVLFAALQKNVAILLGMPPRWMLAAQTAGAALGGMVAPAKLIVGCSTVNLKGKDGLALRITLPYGLAAELLLGVLAWLILRR